MKQLTVKKLAAIAAGAALVGTALAPMAAAALAKSDVYGSDGAPLVNIVYGSAADISDVVWAGNIAKALADNAVVETTVAGTDANGNISITYGGKTTYSTGAKEYKMYLNSASGQNELTSDGNVLTDAQLSTLYNESVTEKIGGSNTSITVQEKVSATVDAKFSQSPDVRDLAALIQSDGLVYEVNLGSGIQLNRANNLYSDTNSSDKATLPWFGSTYDLSVADFSGATPYVKLVKSSASVAYTSGDSITGLTGKNAYAGKAMSIRIDGVVKSSDSATYQANMSLLDDEGNVVDSRIVSVADNVNTVFVDSSSNEALSSNVYIDNIVANSDGSSGTVKVTIGTNTVEIYNSNGYPYDSTSTSGSKPYKAYLTSSSNKFTKIQVRNSSEYWDVGSGNGAVYPTTAGQSLTGKTGAAAIFGQALADGTAGKDFFEIDFAGFEAKESRTSVTLGKNDGKGVSFSEDSRAIGKINFRDASSNEHTLPMAIALPAANSGSSFAFDSKTGSGEIYYETNVDSSGVTRDVNFRVFVDSNTNYINGRTWVRHTSSNVALGDNIDINGGASQQFLDTNADDVIVADNVTYRRVGYDAATSASVYAVDANVNFRRTSVASSDHYGGTTIYLNNNKVWDMNNAGTAQPKNLSLPGNADANYVYVVKYDSNANRIWVLLDDQNIALEYTKMLIFKGTDTTETTGIDKNYFEPDTSYWYDAIGNVRSTGDNNYMVANFQIDDPSTTTLLDANIWLDAGDGGLIGPFTNNNLSTYSYDVAIVPAPAYNLTSGTNTSYMKGGYTDVGGKFVLNETDESVTLSLPQNKEYIIINVVGKGAAKTSTGEVLTGKPGEIVTASDGTQITLPAATSSSTTVKERVVSSKGKIYVDTAAPAAPNILVGGHFVNRLSADIAGIADLLAQAGDVAPVQVSDTAGDILVAGYTAADTGTAATELIAALSAFE
ncbi:MAG: S-layer protein [Candidatus Diapherotrites archaeon]